MKKFFFLTVTLLLAMLAMAVAVLAGEKEIIIPQSKNEIIAPQRDDQLLSRNYGWTIELKRKGGLFGWSRDIFCDSTATVLPPEDNFMLGNYVCIQEDPKFRTTIYWRLDNDQTAKLLEKQTFRNMAGSSLNWSAECISDPYQNGIVKDCEVHLSNGDFYTSFYHFASKLPKSYSIKVCGEIEYRDKLAFTICIRNASPQGSTQKVAEKLREIVDTIRFVQ